MIEAENREVLMTVRRGPGSNFAQRRYKPSSGIGVSQRLQVDRRRELRRLGAEAHLQNVLAPGRHQSVKFGAGILFPVGARGQDDGAGLVEIPLPIVVLARRNPTVMSAPAMPHYIQMEA